MNGIGFSDAELSLQKSTVYNNTVIAMKDVLTAMKNYSIPFSDLEREARVDYIKLESRRKIN